MQVYPVIHIAKLSWKCTRTLGRQEWSVERIHAQESSQSLIHGALERFPGSQLQSPKWTRFLFLKRALFKDLQYPRPTKRMPRVTPISRALAGGVWGEVSSYGRQKGHSVSIFISLWINPVTQDCWTLTQSTGHPPFHQSEEQRGAWFQINRLGVGKTLAAPGTL